MKLPDTGPPPCAQSPVAYSRGRKPSVRSATVAAWHHEIERKTHDILLDLRKHHPVLSLTKIPTASWNAVFRGSSPKRDVCVKIFNERTSDTPRTRGDLNFVGEAMDRLKLAGFCHVLPPLADSSGQYVCRCAGHWIMLFPWDQRFAELRLDESRSQLGRTAEKAGRLLADLHLSCSRYLKYIVEPVEREFPAVYGPTIWASRDDALWCAVRQRLRTRNASPGSLKRLRIAQERSRELQQANPEFFAGASARRILIHGDFRPENLLFGPDGFRRVFDFDLLHNDYPESDVAYGALSFSGPRWFVGSRDWNVCRRFITAYAKASGGIPFSLARLETALRWVVLKALSLSLKEEHVYSRLRLYYELQDKLEFLVGK